MNKTMLLGFALIVFLLSPTSCAPSDLFQAPKQPSTEVILPDDQAIAKLPKWFSLEYHNTKNCGDTIPYKSTNGFGEYANYNFDEMVASQSLANSDSATVIYRYDLTSVVIEQYEVNLVDSTVHYMLDTDGTQLSEALDPQVWLNRAYEIRDATPITFVTVTYSRNTDYSPAETSDEHIKQIEEHGFEKTDYMNTYWLSTSAICNTNQ